jgi:hypothetical protein
MTTWIKACHCDRCEGSLTVLENKNRGKNG